MRHPKHRTLCCNGGYNMVDIRYGSLGLLGLVMSPAPSYHNESDFRRVVSQKCTITGRWRSGPTVIMTRAMFLRSSRPLYGGARPARYGGQYYMSVLPVLPPFQRTILHRASVHCLHYTLHHVPLLHLQGGPPPSLPFSRLFF